MTQRDVMEREVGGGFKFGNACTPAVDSCQCMAKPIQYCKVKYKCLSFSFIFSHLKREEIKGKMIALTI